MDIDIRVESEVLRREGVATTLQGVWTPNDAERNAAWDVLVELVTRVSVVPLGGEEGRLGSALASFAAIFGECRAALKRHGPAVAQERPGELSFADIVAHLLNRVLRPVTAWWHPRVDDLDESGGAQLRKVLAELSKLLALYAQVFAEACDAREFVRYLVEEGMYYQRPES
jgi:hypothetical protein